MRTMSPGDTPRHRSHPNLQCPKVYVYKLPPPLSDVPKRISLEAAFGEAHTVRDAVLFATNQYSLSLILLQKLSSSMKRCRTKNASEADLFFVPVLARPKNQADWSRACASVSPDLLASHLSHLTARTACRHFLIVSKGHYNAHRCDWWSRPQGTLFEHVTRISYSFALHSEELAATELRNEPVQYARMLQRRESSEYPHLFSVPYPSSVHFARGILPRTSRSGKQPRRKILMLFLGSANHGDVEVRRRILRQCEGYNDARVCAAPRVSSGQPSRVLKWLD
jgi:hypothetical protein